MIHTLMDKITHQAIPGCTCMIFKTKAPDRIEPITTSILKMLNF
jgi:hypothetical protein